MPLPGTLAAMKSVAASRRTISSDTILTPADIGRGILVDASGGAVLITLPSIAGDGTAGLNAIGRGGEILIVLAVAGGPGPNDVTIATQDGDTINGGAGPLVLTSNDEWVWLFSDGNPASPGDWLKIGHVVAVIPP